MPVAVPSTMSAPSRPRPLPLSRCLFLLAGLGLLLGSGCASRPPERRPESLQPPLTGRAEYFAGALAVDARVSGFRYRIADENGRPGAHRHAGGPPPDMRPAGGPPGGGEPGRGGPMGSLPRQVLRVNFTNHSDTPVTVAVLELNSLLGNFAPQPAKLTIAPHTTAALEPVSGDVGGTLSWLDVTLALRRDDAKESQVLHLAPAPEGDEAALPPPPR